MSKPLFKKPLKDATGTYFYTHLNPSNNILYVTAKGSQNAQIFYWKPDNTLTLINNTVFKRGQIDFSFFLPRHTVNVWKKEVDRALFVHKNHAEYMSFKMPFRGEQADFNEKIYVPYPAPEPSADMNAYQSGQNVTPKMAEFSRDPNDIPPKSQRAMFAMKERANVTIIHAEP